MENLFLSMIFSTFGTGFLIYGKKRQRMVPLIVGILLMVVPYFIESTLLMVLVCGALTFVPFVIRE